MNEIFFELIRVAIGTQDALPYAPSKEEWMELYEMAKKQSLVGIAFAGLQRLSNDDHDDDDNNHSASGMASEDLEPCEVMAKYWNMPEMLYLKWMGMAAKIQQRNRIVNKQCEKLTNTFRKDGFDVVILKGQSAARRYGNLANLRQSGDIDAWLTGSRKKIKKYISKRYQVGEAIYNHAHVHIFNDTEVEVHFTPSWLYSFPKNKILQKWFSTYKEDCRFDFKEQEGFKSPTIEFDLVFLMLHAYRHLMHEGLGLRQVMDYFFVLTHEEEVRDKRLVVRETLCSLGLLPFAGAILWVINQVFIGQNTNHSTLTTNLGIEPDEKRGKRLLAEIERGGNMGRGDDRTGNSTNRMGYFWEHVSRQWSFMRDYPSEVLWSPLWKAWHFTMRKTGRI